MMCFACGCDGNIARIANYFIPGEGNYSVWQCLNCGDIWNIPLYDVDIDDTQEMAVTIPPDETTDVNLTFEA